jgi:ELWxxDGT repeat protein
MQSLQGDLLNINDSIYFFANDTIFRANWNGTVSSIVNVINYNSMAKFGNNIVFDKGNAFDPISIFDISSSSIVATPLGRLTDYLEVNQDFYFTGATLNSQGTPIRRLAKIDGQTFSTTILDTNYVLTGILGELNSKILCLASPNLSPNDIELYSYDPITNTATLVKDIFPGPTGTFNQSLNGIRTAHKIFFAANDSIHGEELWVTDGTNTGTHLVYNYTPGIDGSDFHYHFGGNNPSDWAYVKGDTMIGTARIGAGGTYYTQMCVTDGNMFYTIDLHPGSTPGNIYEHPRFFTPWNGEIYYQLEVTPAPWGYICKFNPDIITGLHNLNETGGVSIFPNPANTSFTVEANSFDNSTIKIYTISGSIVFEGRFDKNLTITLDINSGIYILELCNKNGQTQYVRFLHE